MRKVEVVVTFLIFFGLYVLIVPQMLLAKYKNPGVPIPKATITNSSPRPTAVFILTPTITPIRVRQNLQPTPTVSLSKNIILIQEINNYRKLRGLSALLTNYIVCSFASNRAKEISVNFNHTGFQQRINFKSLPYPSYSVINENIAMTSNYQQVVTLWENSPGHSANLLSSITYGCVGIFGDYYAFEGWKP